MDRRLTFFLMEVEYSNFACWQVIVAICYKITALSKPYFVSYEELKLISLLAVGQSILVVELWMVGKDSDA